MTRLRSEVGAEHDGAGSRGEQSADALVADAITSICSDDEFVFSGDVVKDDLEALFLALIAGREENPNGSTLLTDLARVFDTEVSPGTGYPTLHDLEEDGLLDRFELVRTKEYAIGDRGRASDRIEERMRQHMVLGLYYARTVEEFADADGEAAGDELGTPGETGSGGRWANTD